MKTFYNIIFLAFFITFTCPSGYATDKFAEMNTYIDNNKSATEEYKLEKEKGKYLLTLKNGNTISHTILFTVNGVNAYLDKLLRVGNSSIKSDVILKFFHNMMDSEKVGVNQITLHVVPENIVIGTTSKGPNPALARIYWEAGYNFNWNEAGAESLYPVLKTFYKTFCPTLSDTEYSNELLKNSNVLVYLKKQNISEDLNAAGNLIELTGKTTQERTDIKKRQAADKKFTKIDPKAEISMTRTKGATVRSFGLKNQPACWEPNKSLKLLGFTPKESSQ